MMKAPKIPTLFKLGRKDPKRFEYSPRFYNERKERLEKRAKEIEAEIKFEERLKRDETLQHKSHEQENWIRFERTKRNRQSNIRLLVILFGLLFISYLILQRLDIFTR
jgi:hypothetical protein